MLTNEQNSKPIWLSQYNNINVENLLQDLANNGRLRHEWKGNEHGEKYIQYAKNEFTRKKGKFSEILTHKLYSKKIMSYLSNSIDSSNECDFNINDYLVKSNDILDEKLKLRYPILFIINENGKYLLLIKNHDT